MENIDNIESRINDLIDSGQDSAAIELASSAVSHNRDDASMWFILGKAFWRLGRRAEAMSAYRQASAIDPSGPAAVALAHAEDIAGFFNPDLFNP